MRTTLNIADDVLKAAKERARGGIVTNEMIDKLREADAY
jgi:hypothetical protein